MQIRRSIVQLALVALCMSLLQGCNLIVPGMNVSAGAEGEHQYSIVKSEDQPGYAVQAASPQPKYVVETITPDLVARLNNPPPAAESPLKPLLPSDVPPEYKIGAGDIVYVTVWDHPELTAPEGGQLRDVTYEGRLVASDGTMFYPFAGRFQAAGMTGPQLGTYLADKLRRVVQDPQIDIRVVGYRANRVQVTGEVKVPGTLTLDDTPKGVIQAIDASGGLTDRASRRRAVLVRKGTTYYIDLSGLLSGEHPVDNPGLEPGDVLHVPDQSADQVFVLGAVTKQTPIPMQQAPLSLMEALTAAGGLDYLRSNDAGVLVFRMPKPGEADEGVARVFTLDLSRPENVLLSTQFQLNPRDVVYVKATAFSQYNAVITQLLPTITTIFQTVGTVYNLQHLGH